MAPTNNEALSQEADRAWLAQVVDAPTAWRARATSAAGLLSTAAATTILGLIFRGADERRGIATVLPIVAAASFALAVITFLLVAVYPSPSGGLDSVKNQKAAQKDFDDSESNLSLLLSYIGRESAPLRRLTRLGSFLGAIAVIATVVLGYELTSSQPYSAKISIISTDVSKSVHALCPSTITGAIPVRVISSSSDSITIDLSAEVCGGESVRRIRLPASSVVVGRS